MTRKAKVVLAVSSALAFIGAGAVAYFYVVENSIFGSGMCGNNDVIETLSPDGESKAVIFRRDCGATTGFSTQLSILDVNEQVPNESGNVLVLDGETALYVTWQDARHLVIEGLGTARTFKREVRFRDVEIAYKSDRPGR